jgi:hypothetical protein
MPPNAKAERTTETTSIGALRGVETFCTLTMPRMSAAIAMGSTKPNSQRHENALRIRPEIVGPMAGATEMTIEMLPMMRPRCAGSTRVRTVVMSSGIMIAVPLACTMRPTSRTVKPGASRAISVPTENRPIAQTNTGRVLKRCSRNPVIGMTTAMVSRKPVVSHWPVAALMSRSSMSRGRATPMMVSLRMTTNAETSSSPITSRVSAADGCETLPVRGAESTAWVMRVLLVGHDGWNGCGAGRADRPTP